jgi:hypothetical protein
MQAQKASDSPRREREGREADLGHRLNKALAGMRPSRRNVNTKYASKERYKAGMGRAVGAAGREGLVEETGAEGKTVPGGFYETAGVVKVFCLRICFSFLGGFVFVFCSCF